MDEWGIVFYIVLGGVASIGYQFERRKRIKAQGLARRWAEAYNRDISLKQPKQREEGDEWKDLCDYE